MDNLTKSAVRRAGEELRAAPSPFADVRAAEVVNRWREAHLEPLQLALDAVHQNAAELHAPVAGRIKKFDTIVDKLARFPSAKLDRFYDIAGCRVVVTDLNELEMLCSRIESTLDCDVNQSRKRNYVAEGCRPESGYRGRHLILRFDGLECGLRLSVELQVRTEMQHLWATAVELYDRARGTRLKFGERNPTSWEFFRRASEVIRRLEEHEEVDAGEIRRMFPISDGIAVSQRIIRELTEASEASTLVNSSLKDKFEFCVIDFVPSEQYMSLVSVDSMSAIRQYSLHEKVTYLGEDDIDIPHDTVLVRGQSADQLSMLYPNYFGDISPFLRLVDKHLDAFC